ncbi:glyoxalase superfamily protein [Paenibacillus montanisoli]|uniref:Bleomycin resistance protein n=1 Tax=Paenibacillus montanisoli TaxID=2081970 RepID=A0A328TZN9_9BACL|nr:glyoxalase superfamily protein [Paenibacillus montanisoli]RAP75909.1 VOC family protein [Paenibacillus montanisoli]
MQKVIPAFRITDYPRSKKFYVEGLGFRVDWEHRFEPHFPVFLQITKDDMTLYLTEHSGDCQVGGLIHFFVPDVDRWYDDLKHKPDITIAEPPNEDLEGLRTMTVVDPDGNQLRICTHL